MKEIEKFREKLDLIDKQLMDIVSQRQEVLKEIAQYKIKTGHPLFDRNREKAVFERARSNAQNAGISANLGEKLMHLIVEGSHEFQEGLLLDHKKKSTQHYKFLIVGGNGSMGKLFVELFNNCGHDVDISDIEDDDETLINKVKEAQIIIVAVDMKSACDVTQKLLPHINKESLLVDINSLKGEICDIMRECPGEALGTHPMFGPTVSSFRKQKMVVCSIKSGPLSDWFIGELGHLGLEIIESEPDQHDKIMSIIQVLVHFKTLSMGLALSRSGVSIDETLDFTSPIYHLELTVIGRLFAQNPELYAEIEMSNPHGENARKILKDAIDQFEKVISEQDKEGFTDIFKSVAAYFSGFQETAMTSSDKIIENIISQP